MALRSCFFAQSLTALPYLWLISHRPNPSGDADIASLQEELLDILSSAADLSNKLAAIIIGYRSEQHAQLALSGFLAFFNTSWNFVVECEVICRRMIMGLRGVVLGQVSVFTNE